MAKSFVSAMIGIAKEEKLITGVDQTLGDFYPEWKGKPKGDIPLHSVLQMQSGLDFIEDYADIANSDVIKIGFSSDVLGYVLDNVDVAEATQRGLAALRAALHPTGSDAR